MTRKKVFKIIGWGLLTICLVLIALIGYGYFKYTSAFDTENKPYQNYIGYIDTDKALLNDRYELCDNGTLYHTYSSAGLKAYAGTKKQFRNAINSEYNTNTYKDYGYLNFRFLVNCEGKPGWFEIIEMNLDLEETPLDKDMVNSLFEFTADPKHWNDLVFKEIPSNYYMYVSYRIENGKVTEIIP